MAVVDPDDGTVQLATALAGGDLIVLFRTAAGKWVIDPAFLVNRANHTGNVPAANVSGLDTAIDANGNVSANTSARHTHLNKATLDAITDAGSGVIISTAERGKIGFITVTQSVDLDAIESKLDSITDVGSGVIISSSERSKLGSITITDNTSLITNAQISLLSAFSKSVTKQSISGTGSQSFDLDSGNHADVTISGAITLDFVNGVSGQNGLIFCSSTNGNTLDFSGTGLTFKKRGASGLLEAYSQITLSAGASDEQVIAYHFRTSTEVIYAID